jgi:hypothetical protein
MRLWNVADVAKPLSIQVMAILPVERRVAWIWLKVKDCTVLSSTTMAAEVATPAASKYWRRRSPDWVPPVVAGFFAVCQAMAKPPPGSATASGSAW